MSNKSLFQPKNVVRIVMAGLLPFCSLMMTVTAARAQEEPASTQTYNFTVTNDTEATITELYVDDADEEEWGESILEVEIAPGETESFEWADEDVEEGDPCMYHVKAVFDDESIAEEIEEGLDFCENPEVIVSAE
jgi:hypothetical protein